MGVLCNVYPAFSYILLLTVIQSLGLEDSSMNLSLERKKLVLPNLKFGPLLEDSIPLASGVGVYLRLNKCILTPLSETPVLKL